MLPANQETATALAAVEQHFASHSPAREWLNLPTGRRQVVVVKGDKLAVHHKEYVSLYRKMGKLQHGMRLRLLRDYAEQGIYVVIYEADTGTILVASAAACLAASLPWQISGAFEGAAEETAFIPRYIFHFVNRPQNSPPADVR